MKGVDGVSLVFLCYNEAENVGRCLEEALKAVGSFGLRDWEVLVIDDGSTDGTAELVERFAESRGERERIRVARHGRNRGYGEAMRTGFAEARRDWVFMTDGDLQFHLEDLGLLLVRAHEQPFVQGYRVGRADPAARLALGAMYRGLVRAAFRIGVRDPECAFRIVRRELVQAIRFRCSSDLVPVELLAEARRRGAGIVEVGVRHRAREAGESKAVSFRVFAGLAREALGLWLRTAV